MDIEVVKVPNDRPAARVKRHGNSPSLYLELVENKERVRQDLVNKEYVPPAEPDVSLSDLEDEEIPVPVPETGEQPEPGEQPESPASAPPPLSELGGAQRRYHRDIERVSADEVSEAEEKRQLLFKFQMLKKKYKDSVVPQYTVLSDIGLMRRSYEETLQNVVLDATVEDYKTYFQTACMAIEWGLRVFSFDITGFTADQMSKMNKYERLLIELCEKHYSPDGSSLPVEVRLFGMILLNAVIFIGTRMFAKRFTAAPPMPSIVPDSPPDAAQRKMRGPRPLDETQIPPH